MGGGATKPKKVQNTDAKLREEYRSLKQKLLLAKRNGGNKKRIRRIRKEMSELKKKISGAKPKKKRRRKKKSKEEVPETKEEVPETKEEEEKVTIKSPSKSLELLNTMEFENKDRFRETTSSRPVRFNLDDEKKKETPFEILLRTANEKMIGTQTMPRHRFEEERASSKCFRVGVDEDVVRNLAKCQELIRNVFPDMDRTRELVAIEIPFPLADSISMKNNVVVYSSPETKANGVREGDLLLMIEDTIVVDMSDADVLRLAERIMKEEENDLEEEGDDYVKRSFNMVFLH